MTQLLHDGLTCLTAIFPFEKTCSNRWCVFTASVEAHHCWVTLCVINQSKIPVLKMTQCSHALRHGARTVSFLKKVEEVSAMLQWYRLYVCYAIEQHTWTPGRTLVRVLGRRLARARICPILPTTKSFRGEMMCYIPSILWSWCQVIICLINSLRARGDIKILTYLR